MFEKFFALSRNNTDIKTEVTSGITTFITMSYILLVNPIILSTTGMDIYAVFTATALCAAIATIMMAFSANLPIALAPGMDLNALFAFIIVANMGYSWNFAITAFFIAGIIYMLLALSNLPVILINSFPKQISRAITVGAGLFIAFIGLRSGGIVVDGPTTLVSLGDLSSAKVIVTLFGVFMIAILIMFKVKGALLAGILLSTFLGIPLGVTSFERVMTPPLFVIPSIESTFMAFEWEQILTFDMLKIVLLILCVDIFGTTGTFFALATKGKWFDKEESSPKLKNAYFSDAFGTVIGALFGTSAITSYIESATGITEGGKTGLTALTVGILFILSLFIAPILLFIPVEASSAALIMVGIFMIAPITEIDFHDYLYSFPSFIAIITMPFTNSISDGVLFALMSYVILAFCLRRRGEVSKVAIIIVLLALCKYIFIG